MFVVLTFAVGFAHGPPAAVTGVGAADPTGPTHVALTEGLAVRDGEAWRYVCPASWGSAPLSPSVAGLHPDEVFLPGGVGLYVAGANGLVDPTGGGPGIADLLGMQRDDDRIVALSTGGPAARNVWDIGAGGVELWSGDDPLSGIAPWGGQIHLVGPVEGALVHVVLDEGGSEVARADLGVATSTNPVLRSTPSSLWLVERSTGVEQLATFPDRIAIGPTAQKVLGPVEVDGRTWAALDGVLHEVLAEGLAAGPDPRPADCLEAIGPVAWACAGGILHPLAADGTWGEPIVGPADIGPPDLTLVEDAGDALCFSEWRVWAGDAGVDPGPEPGGGTEEPPPLVVAGEGCGCDSDGGSSLGAFLVPWLFRRRRCPRSSPSSWCSAST